MKDEKTMMKAMKANPIVVFDADQKKFRNVYLVIQRGEAVFVTAEDLDAAAAAIAAAFRGMAPAGEA